MSLLHRRLPRVVPPALVLIAFVALWQAATTAGGIDPAVLPGPRLVATATWDDRANLWPAVRTTTTEAVLGLLLAVVIAFVVAVVIDGSKTLRRSVYPLVVASQTLPIIALAPLVVVWFGFGIGPKVDLVALFSFFPVTVGLVQGLASVDPQTLALLRTMRAGRLTLLRLRLPGALPQMFTGLRISVTYAFTSAIVAEFVGATQGIGVYMNSARGAAPSQTDLIVGATVVTAVLTVALFVLVGLLQRLAMPWQPPVPPMTATGGAIEVRALSRIFQTDRGDVEALRDVSLAVGSGEFVSLIGPSGCGKSTLFAILAGLDEPSAGEVLLGPSPAVDRLGLCSYMPQHDALLGWRRVIDNVTLPLELAGVGRRAARRRAEPLLDRFGLGEFAQAWPWQLSGGMRQRVAFLRTVISEPSRLLLDEPFGALDGITRADLQEWLAQVWAAFGSTVLLITHDVAEAVFLSDRIFVMGPRPGRVVAELVVDLPRPRHLEVAETEAFLELERRLRAELRAAVRR